MKLLKKTLLLISTMAVIIPSTIMAARLERIPSIGNYILFIENNIDNEYFITPRNVSPLITGSNVWTKYDVGQTLLGYIESTRALNDTAPYNRRYVDIWLENSTIQQPFLGLQCYRDRASCPSSGYLPPQTTDAKGFYGVDFGLQGSVPSRAVLSANAFERLRTLSTPDSTVFNINVCDTDYSSYLSCRDRPNSDPVTRWTAQLFTVRKAGHLTLEATNAFQHIWVASDGTPAIGRENESCQLGVVRGADGIICKMLSYTLRQDEPINSSTYTRIYANASVLGFTPSASSVQISGNGQTWYNYNNDSIPYQNIFTPGGKYVSVFLSKEFLKATVDSGTQLGQESPFTFGFRNALFTASGFYQTTPSLALTLTPREYGISIESADGGESASASGQIGTGKPIELDYTVTVSGPRQADTITAQVIGDSTTVDGVPYCLFQSAENDISVAIPAYLQYSGQQGGVVRKSNSCSEPAINMNDALWQRTPWDVNNGDDGSYFSTNLKLLFPMNDRRSTSSLSGSDWEGVVSASGEIKVTANWVGVDR